MNNNQPHPIVLNKTWSDAKAQYEEHVWKNFRIVCRMAFNAPAGAEHLPTFVEQDGKQVWHFDKEGQASMVFLREYGNEPVLALTTPSALVDILFVADLPKLVPIKVGGKEIVFPLRPVTEIALAKRAIAENIGKMPAWKKEEAIALYDHDTTLQAKRLQEDRARRAEEEAKKRGAHTLEEAARTAKINKIMARTEIKCFTKDGGAPRRGRPVVGNEWECLRNSTFCISVVSYDAVTGECGELLDAFRVAKSGAKAKKQNAEAVQKQAPVVTTTGADDVEAEDAQVFEIKGERRMVPVYVGVKPSMIDLPIPFGVRDGNVTTIYVRKDGGKLDTLGVHRKAAQHESSAV